jgi:hypothetical protein
MPPGGLYISATSMRFRGGINVSLARRLVRKSSLIAQKAINTRNFDSGSGHQLLVTSHPSYCLSVRVLLVKQSASRPGGARLHLFK